ncbi:hypothetical protein CEXT_470111 [Caerostris extrusa]|uniref:Uncharacterized protein n=1 Tax=Caerostris extrusa TaxID=172846 RepID=A0AAV4WWJ9_CAEEX|nr:hypothetical protein CEXT_470111 [Caerostris extrusa]
MNRPRMIALLAEFIDGPFMANPNRNSYLRTGIVFDHGSEVVNKLLGTFHDYTLPDNVNPSTASLSTSFWAPLITVGPRSVRGVDRGLRHIEL